MQWESRALDEISLSSAKHYEAEVAFFQSFLDPYMKYGSGYYAPGDGFETASVHMLDRAIDQARLSRDRIVRVLDVGSGWGSVIRRLQERAYDVEYHHINPSEVQRAFILARFGRAAYTHCAGLESAELASEFDAIFVHDSFCHLADKQAMLAKLARALAPRGRIVLQDTFYLSAEIFEKARDARTTRFIQGEVFGFAELVPLDVYAADVASVGLAVALLEDVSDHYKRTVAAWLQRLTALDDCRFGAQREECLKYLRRGAACMGYSTRHYFSVLERRSASLDQLRKTLRTLRQSAPRELSR